MEKILVVLIFLPSILYGKVKQFDVYPSQIRYFTALEMCKAMGHLDNLMVDFQGANHVDCMGKLHNISDACIKMEEKVEGQYFFRGYFDNEKRKGACQFGSKGFVVLTCDERDMSAYCGHEKEGCEKLQKIFAQDLEVTYSTMGESDDGKTELRCYFTKDTKTELDEIRNYQML